MSKYERIYNKVFDGKIYKSKELTDFIRRLDKAFPLYCNNNEISDCFLHNLFEFLDNTNIDLNLIDDYLLIITGPHHVTCHEYFIDLLKTLFMPLNEKDFGVYMEVFNNFLHYSLMNKNNRDFVEKLSYHKLIDLHDGFIDFLNTNADHFSFHYDYELPTLLYGYYYANNLDFKEVNDILAYYLDNRDYYLDTMQLNGIYYPYVEDDTIPKFFLPGFHDIYKGLVPILIDDYKRRIKKKNKII